MDSTDQEGHYDIIRKKNTPVEVQIQTGKKKEEDHFAFVVRVTIEQCCKKKKKPFKTRFWEAVLKLVIENYIFLAACHVLVFLILLHHIGVKIHG
jgi:hypothetical protein